jgi:hypothetical protein
MTARIIYTTMAIEFSA